MEAHYAKIARRREAVLADRYGDPAPVQQPVLAPKPSPGKGKRPPGDPGGVTGGASQGPSGEGLEQAQPLRRRRSEPTPAGSSSSAATSAAVASGVAAAGGSRGSARREGRGGEEKKQWRRKAEERKERAPEPPAEVWVETVVEDHNTDACGMCSKGGDLLCCDRCPRAFHVECLGVNEDDLPEGDWICHGGWRRAQL